MKDILSKVLNFLAIAVLLAVAGVVAFFLWFKESVEDTELTITSTEEIGLTPEQVQSIKTIGEWEFLAVSSEELIDTTRKGVFSDDHLVRIYYGTVRLGVNMHQLEPGWISASDDSLLVTLPPIGILDNNFIDETRTKAFYESGKWTAADREDMFRRAYNRIKSQCLTSENIRAAEINAGVQIRSLFSSMGFNNVMVRFEE
ncbi:MAG: DUF4230 domain-containing protein [Prevotella sp.]|nr:DUF4230 domain-containing protein [Prevotella sp.]